MNLGRATMTQLTEGGVMPLAPASLEISSTGDSVVVVSKATDTAVAVAGLPQHPTFRQAGLATTCWDGAPPEARDPETGAVIPRRPDGRRARVLAP